MPKKKSKKPKISVVIPSWNSEKQMKENLPYVYKAAARVGAEIVIVDDNSQYDDSWGFMQSEQKQGKIRAYNHNKNIGFSANVNKGVKLAKGDLIMLLNTDVRPSVDCFEKCIEMFKDKDVFAVGFNSGEAWMGGEWGGGLFHHFKVKPVKTNKNQINPSLWASGGQAAFDKKKWNQLGGMNLLYKPFYWEDTDLGYSAWKRGWKVLWAPECKCVHDHQKSVIASNFTKEFVMATAQRNQFLFIWKNISDKKFLFNHIIRLPYYLVKFPLPVLKAILKLPEMLRERAEHSKHWVKSDQEIIKQWER
jgi:O-antigen biosynthesis protein